MKRSAVLIALSVCLPVLAEEAKPWPQKGDTVYVSAKLAGFNPLTLIVPGVGGGKMPDVPELPECSPLTVKSAVDEQGELTAKDDLGNKRKLAGAWLARLHRSREECREKIEREGLPRVQSRGGWRYELVPKPVAAH